MKINISNTLNGFNGGADRVFAPDPPRPPSVKSLLKVQRFDTTKTTVAPFEDFTASWVVEARKQDVTVTDFEFRLAFDPYGNSSLAQMFGATGNVEIAIWEENWLTLQAKRKSDTRWESLPPSRKVSVDQSACVRRDLPVDILLMRMDAELNAELGDITVLKRKGDLIYNWRVDHLEIKAPFEIDLNNFFNGDFTITFSLYIRANITSNNDCNLIVDLDYSPNADFHWLEDVLSFGNSASIAKTIEKLIPFILTPIVSDWEASLLEEFCQFIDVGNLLDTHTLLDVDLSASDMVTFVLCDTGP